MTTATKIGLNVMFLVFGVLVMAQMFGLFPDGAAEKLRARIALSESVAIQCSIAANRDSGSASWLKRNRQIHEIKMVLKSVVERNDEVLTAGMRLKSGLVVSIGEHNKTWKIQEMARNSENISVPIVQGNKEWGQLEFCFCQLRPTFSFLGMEVTPLFLSILAVTCATGFGATLYYSRVFAEAAGGEDKVPSRVRSALDSLSDGLLVLNEDEKIVFANRAFEEATGIREEDLLGNGVGDLNWTSDWDELLEKEVGEEETRKITLRTGIGEVDFTVGASEILSDKGSPQGKLICFNDVTILEKRREELMYTMRSLQSSRDMIKEQNEQLKILATRDPLTNCWNRRSFFEEFYPLWKSSTSKSCTNS